MSHDHGYTGIQMLSCTLEHILKASFAVNTAYQNYICIKLPRFSKSAFVELIFGLPFSISEIGMYLTINVYV